MIVGGLFSLLSLPLLLPQASIALTIFIDSESATSPKTTCFPSSQLVTTVVMKNWDPLLMRPLARSLYFPHCWDEHTYWGQHWPLKGDQGGCASSGSSRRRTSPHILTSRRYPGHECQHKVNTVRLRAGTDIATSKVTALKHEVGDDTVEF